MNKLLLKYFTDVISEMEKKVLFDELEKDLSLKEEFIKLHHIFTLSDTLFTTNNNENISIKLKELMKTTQKRKLRRFSLSFAKYAAVAAIISCIWIIVNFQLNQHEKTALEFTTIEVPKGQTVYITLPDGSKVWLSSRSKLTFSNLFNGNERVVELNGEGFFAVSKSEDRPFIVNTQKYNIQVTGTQFNVLSYSESPLFEADLIEGSVFVYDENYPQDDVVCLKPNEAVYFDGNKLIKSHSTFLSSHLTDGIYYFENTPFEDLKKRLELWYNVRFNVKNSQILAYEFSGKFNKGDDIERILNAIKETGKFSFKTQSDYVIDIY